MIFRIHRPLLACCLSVAGVVDGAEVTLGIDTPPVMDGVRNLAGAADAPSNVQLQYASSNIVSGETNGVLGQTFTTGPNPAGYSLTSISFQQVSHDTTWWLGVTLGLRVFQTIDDPGSGVQDISVLAAETGAVPDDGAGLQQSVPGTSNVWVTIELDQTPPLHLEPDTQYGFDIQALGTPGTGPFLMEWNGIHADELAGGQAIINGTPGTPSVRSVWLGRGPVDGDRVFVDTATGGVEFVAVPRFVEPGSTVAPGSLVAPMPGMVIRVAAALGDAVTAGQPLLVLEAMKMEHTLAAPNDGVLAELNVTAGQQVDVGTVLALVEST